MNYCGHVIWHILDQPKACHKTLVPDLHLELQRYVKVRWCYRILWLSKKTLKKVKRGGRSELLSNSWQYKHTKLEKHLTRQIAHPSLGTRPLPSSHIGMVKQQEQMLIHNEMFHWKVFKFFLVLYMLGYTFKVVSPQNNGLVVKNEKQQ